jgi:hypothetical protein
MHFLRSTFEESTTSRNEERVPMTDRPRKIHKTSNGVPCEYNFRGIHGCDIVADRVSSVTRRRKASMEVLGQLYEEHSSESNTPDFEIISDG